MSGLFFWGGVAVREYEEELDRLISTDMEIKRLVEKSISCSGCEEKY